MPIFIINANIKIQAPDTDAAIATFHKRRPRMKIFSIKEVESSQKKGD